MKHGLKSLAAAVLAIAWAGPALAGPAFSCGSFAIAGGAELLCSHIDPKAPAQICNFSWALVTTANSPSIVQGTFTLAPGVANSVVYQGFGFNSALSNPIVLCQGRKSRG